jgi:hypothetical protein
MPFLPPKRHAVLIVDPQTVPATQIARQPFQSVPRWYDEISQAHGDVQCLQLSLDTSPERMRDPPGGSRVALSKEVGGRIVGEGLDHGRCYMLHR